MQQRPQFKKHLHVEFVEPDILFLLTETNYHVLNGRAYQYLAPLLTGQHTITELLILLSGQVSPPEILYALNQLNSRGYLAEGNGTVPREEAAFWHTIGADAHRAAEQRQNKTVAVRAAGGCDEQPLLAALESVGIRVTGEPEAGADLTIVLTDDYLREELSAQNERALASGQPWLPVKLTGNILWIGPLFEPGQTACWACLARRIEENRQVESYLLRKRGQTEPLETSRAALEATMRLGANIAATEIVTWIAQGQNRSLRDQLLTFDVMATESRKHAVVRRPQCPLCGDPEDLAGYREPAPIALASNPKRFRNDGGHRTLFPEEVYARYQHHISPISGAISSLTDITGEVNGIAYSYAAVHPFPVVHDDVSALRSNLRGRSGGKGMTNIQAKVSGIGEALERYSGIYRPDEDLATRSTYRDLGEEAVHLHDLLCFSERQYATRREWNASQQARYHIVPNPFNETALIDWTAVWSLAEQRFRYVPSVYCYYGHPDLSYFFCGSDANGCSAGHTREEAILQGFLELVERDGVAMWWYNRASRPAVDVESFGIPYYLVMQSFYEQLQREIWVLDLTTDLGIPIFAALSRRTDREVEDIMVGFGAHLDPKIGILRALTELNQFLPIVKQREADGSTRYLTLDRDTLEWLKGVTLAGEPWLASGSGQAVRTSADYALTASDDLRDDVQFCVERARAVGLETLVLDQSRADVGMKVCRVMVPGLRHFWRRLGAGRLYDVPVQLGWIDRPIAESDLNPHSMFF